MKGYQTKTTYLQKLSVAAVAARYEVGEVEALLVKIASMRLCGNGKGALARRVFTPLDWQDLRLPKRRS